MVGHHGVHLHLLFHHLRLTGLVPDRDRGLRIVYVRFQVDEG